MKRKTIFISLCIIVVLGSVGITLMSSKPTSAESHPVHSNPAPEQQIYRLLWQDDFNGKKLDESRWSKINRMPPAWACHMSKDDRLYRVKKGYLRLYCMRNTWLPNDTAPVLTGGIDTMNKFEMGYGKVEVRARMTGAMGCWPAIWVSRTSRPGMSAEDYAEVDLLERYNHDNKIHHTVHTHYIDTQKKQKREECTKEINIDVSKWNVYAVEILPQRIVFSVNGQTTFVYNKINNPLLRGHWPFGRTKCRILIDMQWGNPWLRDRRPQELPCWMDIDWVRVYGIGQ